MANNDDDIDVPVLIVGGGPVGLALAADLGWRGIRSVLVEQTDGAIPEPKMDSVNPRTMEVCRRWGIVDRVENGGYPRDYKQDVLFLTTLVGHEIAREARPAMRDEVAPIGSPQHRERCPQDMFDPVLREFARAMPEVALEYRTKLVTFTQSGDFVDAQVEDLRTEKRRRIRSRFIVGCDGASSMVRKRLEIPLSGKPVLTYTTNIVFRCPNLLSLHNKGRAYRHIFVGPEGVWSSLVAINGADRWRFSIIGSPEQKDLTLEEIHRYIRLAIGADFEYEILTFSSWFRRELLADSFGGHRAFICGDAAHIMSPTGGLGMNTGIIDAVDLAWKIAGVLDGWGGSALLNSYEAERRPVAARNIAESSKNLKAMLSAERDNAIFDETPEGEQVRARVGKGISESMRREWYGSGLQLGYRYDNSPICWNEGFTESEPWATRDYVPAIRPGARAPHVWLSDSRSTLDLFNRAFVLLRIGRNPLDASSLIGAAKVRKLPLEVIDLAGEDIETIYDRRLVLVRPDGHIAWCGDEMPELPLAVIDRVRGAAPDIAFDRESARASLLTS